MTSITPRPIPASFASVAEREGWTSAPLATVRETQWNRTDEATLVASPQSVSHAFQYEEDTAVNDRVFEPAGSTLAEALQFAKERALRSFEYQRSNWQSQAVLQAADGAFFVTGLARQDRPIPFDLDEDTGGSGSARRVVEVTQLHEDLRAIVGRETWAPAPGVEALVQA